VPNSFAQVDNRLFFLPPLRANGFAAVGHAAAAPPGHHTPRAALSRRRRTSASSPPALIPAATSPRAKKHVPLKAPDHSARPLRQKHQRGPLHPTAPALRSERVEGDRRRQPRRLPPPPLRACEHFPHSRFRVSSPITPHHQHRNKLETPHRKSSPARRRRGIVKPALLPSAPLFSSGGLWG